MHIKHLEIALLQKKKNEMKKNKTPFTNLEVTFKIHLAQKYEGAYDASEVD